MPQKTVKIDGSLGEGGGQVLRIALCLSALYKIPIEIKNIRAKRPKPGLSVQLLHGVKLIKDMCNAEVDGDQVRSTNLIFKPGTLEIKQETYEVDTKTAGCIGLLIQAILPCALFSSKAATYIFKGGTNVPYGPHIEYIINVFKPTLNKFGADFRLNVKYKGYYPRGGGEVHMEVSPIRNLNGIEMINTGVLEEIRGWSFIAGSTKINDAQKITNEAKASIVRQLCKKYIEEPPIYFVSYVEREHRSVGKGTGVNLFCKTSNDCIYGGCAVGIAKKHSTPGKDAANQLLYPILSNGCVDEHLQDQIIILMVLANGPSKIKIGKKYLTTHAKTAMQVAQRMLASKGLRFSVNQDRHHNFILECNGLGLVNQFLNQ